jgi:hypothetical protein
MRVLVAAPLLLWAALGLADPVPPIPDLHPCGGLPHLISSPIDDTDLASIWPLGNLDPPLHVFPASHMYLARPSMTLEAPVSSPGNLVLQVVKRVDVTVMTTGERYQEFGFFFGVCEGVKITFGHVVSVAARITDAIAGRAPDYHTESVHGDYRQIEDVFLVALRFHPRELIGLTSPHGYGTDFGAFDLNGPPLPFIHPERYGLEARLNRCPLDLFIPPVRQFLESRIGAGGFEGLPFLPRTAPPVCGTVNQDVAETLQGNWFVDVSAPDPEDHHVALVHDSIDPNVPVFSLGDRVLQVNLPVAPGAAPDTVPFPTGTYRFTPGTTGFVNRDFGETEVGYGYCYEHLLDGNGVEVPHTILRVNLIGPETMRIEARYAPTLGGCPPVPSGSSTGYPLSLFAGDEFNR